MTTTEDLETQIEYIVNRYKDIDKEKEEKITEYKTWINNISICAPFIVFLILAVFLIGIVYGVNLFH